MSLQKFIGTAGEVKVRLFLKENGFVNIMVFENAAGNGLDIIAVKKYGSGKDRKRYILSVEVKTTQTNGSPSLSKNQRLGYLNAGKILLEAAEGKGRFHGRSQGVERRARSVLQAFTDGAALVPLAVTLNVDKGSVHASYPFTWNGVDVDRVRVYRLTPDAMPRKVKIYDSDLKGRWPKGSL